MADQQSGKGPVALVTGATGIVGPGICRTLRREGFRIAACATSWDSFKFDRHVHDTPLGDGEFVARLEGRESCRRLVSEIEERLGPVALLVNNAAINPGFTNLADLTEATLHRAAEIDLFGPIWLIQACEKSLVEAGGSIVNISSVHVKKNFEGMFVYDLLKAALETLTTSLALELGPKGVRMNAIRLGLVPGTGYLKETAMRLPAEQAQEFYRAIAPAALEGRTKMSFVRRAGSPEDVGELVAYLASPGAAFMHGAVIPLDGGFGNSANYGKTGEDWRPTGLIEQWLKDHGVTPAPRQ